MSIRVTCNKCHTRFNVSEKFAGKEGPCPKCKSKIKIPGKSEEVVIAAPSSGGPVDTSGRPVLSPIKRKETKLTSVQITLIVVSVVGFLAGAMVLRIQLPEPSDFPTWLLGLAALMVAPPLGFSAYAFLRNQELDSFYGRELWVRVFVCSAIYAVTWVAMPLASFAFNDSYEVGSYVTAAVGMIGVGGLTAMFCFDLDFIMGAVHYGLFLGVCFLGRLIAGVGVLPTNLPQPELAAPMTMIDAIQTADLPASFVAMASSDWFSFGLGCF